MESAARAMSRTHSDGLDDDAIEAEGVHDVGDLAGRQREAAERAARCHGADEDAVVHADLVHADAIAEQRAAGER